MPAAATRRPVLSSLELRCPPLPHTIVEALDLIDHPQKMDKDTVAQMVARDPAVAARLLQNVNSAYYGLKREVTSVERAVVLIGPVAVTGVVVGMNMLRLRSVIRDPVAADAYMRLMKHLLATAFLVRHLDEGPPRGRTSGDGPSDMGLSFTAGLLHDFGKIILVYNHAREAASLYDEERLQQHIAEPNLCRLEALLFGCDHAEAGAFAARKLNFPESLVTVIERHHDSDLSDLDDHMQRLIRKVRGANLAANALGFGFGVPIKWAQCAAHPVWEHLYATQPNAFESAEAMVEDLRLQHYHLTAYLEPLTRLGDEVR
jgi:putative nucleotidyltransferase with HDIG domain